MYCKHCGKEIDQDSRFCRFCGKVVEETKQIQDVHIDTISQKTHNSEQESYLFPSNKKVEVSLSTNKKQPMQVEVARKSIVRKSTIADEIIANVKMICWAVALWLIYMTFFTIFRQHDISSSTPFGVSCYDSYSIRPAGLDWERHYAELMNKRYVLVKNRVNPNDQKAVNKFEFNERDKHLEAIMNGKPGSDYLKSYSYDRNFSTYSCEKLGDSLATKLRLTESEIDSIKTQATKLAGKELVSFNKEVNEIRRNEFHWERIDHMKWSAIILLCITIIGRYIIIFVKWVINNSSTT